MVSFAYFRLDFSTAVTFSGEPSVVLPLVFGPSSPRAL